MKNLAQIITAAKPARRISVSRAGILVIKPGFPARYYLRLKEIK